MAMNTNAQSKTKIKKCYKENKKTLDNHNNILNTNFYGGYLGFSFSIMQNAL